MQGKFKPKNPQKYLGNPTDIVYRSKWELDFFFFCDRNEEIVAWGSEELIIPYTSPLDNRTHRYYPDVLIKTKSGDVILIEIKPYEQTLQPTPTKRKTQRYINEVTTYVVNQAKWEAARAYCNKKGWTFQLMTEKELYKKK